LSNSSSQSVAALARTLLASAQDSTTAPDPDPTAAERRAEARYPTQDPVELEIVPGPREPIFGTVLDVSRSGLRLALSNRIDRGEQVKVKLHRNVIFGEVRYCRPAADGFQVGVRIQDLVRPPARQSDHIADDQLSLYAVGKGLSVAEVIEVREHLACCERCRAHLAEKDALLNPSRRPGRRPPEPPSD
jgi:PilZ domain